METFRMARLYVYHCGFSCVPVWYRQKRLMFKGVTFQQRPPALSDLTHWFTGKPANIAIVPGEISDNLCILDFDDLDSWSVFHSLTAWAGPVVRTSRGVHLYVRVRELPFRNGQGFFEGVHFGQVIAHGSITAPPSVHPSGAVYAWHGSPLTVPWCASLADIGVERRDMADDAAPAPAREFQPGPKRQPSAAINSQEAYVSAAIRGECDKILSTRPGNRNRQLYLSALKLAKYSSLMPAENLASFLESAARQAGLIPSEIRATLTSGFSTGIKNGVI